MSRGRDCVLPNVLEVVGTSKVDDLQAMRHALDPSGRPPHRPGCGGAPGCAGRDARIRLQRATYAIPSPPTGVNWVLAARLVCIAYGVVTVIGLLIIGFLVRHVDVPVLNPATGAIVYQTVDLGGILAVTAIVAACFFALIAWLTGYTLARVIMLLLMLLAALVTLSRMSGEPLSIAIGSLTSLLFDCAFAFVLIMSLVSSPRT